VMFMQRRRHWHEPDSHWLRNFVVFMGVIGILTVAGYWAVTSGHIRGRSGAQQGTQGQRGQGQAGQLRRARPLPARKAHFSWPIVIGLGGLLVIGGVAVLVRGRRPLPPLPPRGVEQELVEAVETSLDELRSEKDARRAVIAAYASMERVLADHGLGRRPAETPFEYLARVLLGLQVRETAVNKLTQLFEFAKFSTHEIDEAMKEEAIEALTEVRDDLRGEEAVAA
jgi:hypothetical protein